MSAANTRILFNDKMVVRDNVSVAGINIASLLECAKDVVGIERVSLLTEEFDRALLHLDDTPLDDFLKNTTKPLVALRLTTSRPGVPVAKAHVKKGGPLRIVLAVRRMEALNEPEVWTAFLRATEKDCEAVYDGRLSEVGREASAMLRLFVEREEVLPAMRILCVGFQEAHRRAASAGSPWKQRARETEQAGWWLQALDHVLVTRKDDKGEEVQMTWQLARENLLQDAKAARRKNAESAAFILVQRIAIEALRWSPESESKIGPLVTAFANGSVVSEDLVNEASNELLKLLK